MSSHHAKPPWKSCGNGLVLPCVVRAESVPLPPPFEAATTAGRTLGALVYLQYTEPSPRTYHELIWISALVRCVDPRYDVPSGWGPLYYVARSYVDDPDALETGAQQWGLPRTAARFSRQGNRIGMEAADGTELVLNFKPRGFTFMAPARLSTIQHKRQRVVRFRARGRAEAQFATYDLEHFVSGHSEWDSFEHSTMLPGLASYLKAFDTEIQAADDVPRALESLRPMALGV